MTSPAKKLHTFKTKAKTNDSKTEQSFSTGRIVAIVAVLVGVLVVASVAFVIVRQMGNMIEETTVSNMSELASHDAQIITAHLNESWNNLEGMGERLETEEYSSIEDLQDMIHRECTINDFNALYLVDDKGNLYSDFYTIRPHDKTTYVNYFKDGVNKFVVRINQMEKYPSQEIPALLYGKRFDSVTVDGVTFVAAVGVNKITDVEKNFQISSFSGAGLSSVVDSDGFYLFKLSNDTNITNRTNFFELVSHEKIFDYTVDEVVQHTQDRDPFIFSWLNEGDVMVTVAEPLPDTDWNFVISVPQEVFSQQSDLLVSMTVAVLLVALFVVIILAFIIFFAFRRTVEAQANAKARTDFLSNMSHEIRTPLNGLVGLNYLMGSNLDDKDKMEGYIEKSRNTTQYLLSLVNDILDMSKLQAGKFDISYEPMSVQIIVDTVHSMQRETFKSKNIDFHVDCNLLHPCIVGDNTHLQQVLMNILGNASKFTSAGGRVAFDVWQEMQPPQQEGRKSDKRTDKRARTERSSAMGDDRAKRKDKPTEAAPMGTGVVVYTYFRIADNGCGMSPDFLDHIFDTFAQERNHIKSSQKGTGLGMSISYLLIEQMHGTITVESELGEGSTFTVMIPAYVSEDTPVNIPVAAKNSTFDLHTAEGRGLRILLADDNDLNAGILGEILEDEGVEVTRAVDGREAVNFFKQSEEGYYDLILMDIQMPNLTGYEATEEIRALSRRDAQSIIIFACTANSFKEDRDRALECGMNDFLSKPVDVDEMLSKLSEVSVKSK